MSKPSERLGLDLADSLPGNSELRAYLFQGVLAAAGEPEAELQEHALSVRESREASLDTQGEIVVESGLVGPQSLSIRQKVLQVRIFADRCFQGAGPLGGIENEPDLRIG